MANNRVTYNVGTSNKFAGFYDDTELAKLSRHPQAGPMKPVNYPREGVNQGYQYRVPYTVPPTLLVRESADNLPTYTDDNIFDTRARGRHTSRRFRGNPNSARKFDRVSGTGRGKEIKKQGGGGHNWGSLSREPKQSNEEGEAEENDLTAEMKNLNVNGNANHENKENPKEKVEKNPKTDMMDFASYKLLQQSKRCNLPTFTVNDKKDVKTDVELQNDGYVKYVKQPVETKSQEKVKVINSHASNNPANVLPNFPSSFRDRRSKPKFQGPDRNKNSLSRDTNSGQKTRVRVKAPDLADLKMFPCLDLKS